MTENDFFFGTNGYVVWKIGHYIPFSIYSFFGIEPIRTNWASLHRIFDVYFQQVTPFI